MAELSQIKPSARGKEIVTKALERGAGLSAKLITTVDSWTGDVFGILSSNSTMQRANNVDAGGIPECLRTMEYLVKHLVSVCEKREESIIIFQDIWADPAHFSDDHDDSMLIGPAGVYYVFSKNSCTRANLISALRSITSFSFLVVVSEVKLFNFELDLDQAVALFAKYAFEIYVSAYDRESMLGIRFGD